jgi:hypothetical protein
MDPVVQPTRFDPHLTIVVVNKFPYRSAKENKPFELISGREDSRCHRPSSFRLIQRDEIDNRLELR